MSIVLIIMVWNATNYGSGYAHIHIFLMLIVMAVALDHLLLSSAYLDTGYVYHNYTHFVLFAIGKKEPVLPFEPLLLDP